MELDAAHQDRVPPPDIRGTYKQWLTISAVCLGALMIVLNTTIVTVALPSITIDLRLSGPSLTWMLDAYMLSFAGFLLLGGRLGDIYGQRHLFLIGIVIFTLASLMAGLSGTPAALIAARTVQGLGGAAVTAVSLPLMLNICARPVERARALGIYGLVCAAGGGLGEVLGGLLTRAWNWHSVFLVNLPLGVAVYVLCSRLLPRHVRVRGAQRVDVASALTITAALVLLADFLIHCNEASWRSFHALCPLLLAGSLLSLFVYFETRASDPLISPRVVRARNFVSANAIGALWAGGSVAWLVIGALYLQRVLIYEPLHVGLAFVPGEAILGLFSAGLSTKVVMRFGARGPLVIGLLLVAIGLGLFARAPVAGTFSADVLPAMLTIGLGSGMASTPLLLRAMSGIRESDSGMASGIINTSFLIGSALGVAVLAHTADQRTAELARLGADPLTSLNGGYHLAFAVASVLTVTAALLGLLRDPRAQ